MLSIVYEDLDSFFDYLPENIFFMLDSMDELEESASDFQNSAILNYKTTVSENRLCVLPDSIYLKWDEIRSAIASQKHTSFKTLDMTAGALNSRQPSTLLFEYQDNSALSLSLKREGIRENPLAPLVDW